MMTVQAFARDYIFEFEDGRSSDPNVTHSLDRDDSGNWQLGFVGGGLCVGSNHGVTASALCARRGVPVVAITQEAMHHLKIEEAAQIAVMSFYAGPMLNLLPWDPVVASVMDMGWGAGPVMAKKLLQRLLQVADDGMIGSFTVRAYDTWVRSHGIEVSAQLYAAARDNYYDRVVLAQPIKAKYLKGWKRRTAYYVPTSPWWARFNA